jgi:hypothetical protein
VKSFLIALLLSSFSTASYAFPPEYNSFLALDMSYPPIRFQGWTLFQYTIPRYHKTFKGLTDHCWHGDIHSNPYAQGRRLPSPGWYRIEEDLDVNDVPVTVFADVIGAELILKQVCILVD